MSSTSEATIVVVEADILIRHLLAEYLRECGYTVLQASDPEQARTYFGQPDHGIDVVLADAHTPDANGFALAQWIRAHHPATEILLAGSVKAAVGKAANACEEGPAVRKPYDHQLVLDHIRQMLAARDRGAVRNAAALSS
jgi:DNA-binding response OmpR family regulator